MKEIVIEKETRVGAEDSVIVLESGYRVRVIEASEVTYEELFPEKQNDIQYFIKIVFDASLHDVEQIFEGVHGNIVIFNQETPFDVRLFREVLEKLLENKNFRWIKSENNQVTIGF